MEPLANKIRPNDLKEFVGQKHLVGEGKPLKQAIENRHLFSFILWGPPGVGKTTLARIYAKSLNADFYELSAVSAGKDDIRKIIANVHPLPTSPLKEEEKNTVPPQGERYTKSKILFLDEIHRFNKAQQDFLLPFVEKGDLYLIGATTENPSFEVIAPLLSRCRVFVLNGLDNKDMDTIISRAVKNLTPTLSEIGEGARNWLTTMANGDARQALTMLDACLKLYTDVTIENLKNTLQSKHLRYDKAGEEHYNTISAFIKSMRASQSNAALYYLARMVEAGEDPLFIARRMVIFASEDIGIAQPTALVVANAVFRACETIGYPECAINLAHGTAYLAQAKKDRSAYDAYFKAQKDVKAHGNLPVPLKLRNASTELMKDLDYGKDYVKYDTDDFLPEELKGKKYLN